MKKIMHYVFLFATEIVLIAFIAFIVISSLSSCTSGSGNRGAKESSHAYESDDTFYNGEILYPDYVHNDTLVVTNASALNKLISDPMISSDGEIAELLYEYTRDYTIKGYKAPDSVTFRAKRIYAGDDYVFESGYVELIRIPYGYQMGDTIYPSDKTSYGYRLLNPVK